ncbi:DUF1287 domain-containing protein [Microvirga sp. TS319]|uniref:DUF1287 domain-containing protein n=1 Tax=Microvirga sp. TS319 TaxID=3241165 RepID=UPI00351A2487
MRFIAHTLIGAVIGSLTGATVGFFGWLEYVRIKKLDGVAVAFGAVYFGFSLMLIMGVLGAAIGLWRARFFRKRSDRYGPPTLIKTLNACRAWPTAFLLLSVWIATPHAWAETAENPARRLVNAARAQVGVTLTYNPAYVRLSYPGGDVAPEQGVCTDVIVRAYRAALKIDLQKLVHEDMKSSFAAYPRQWALRQPDPNIDHRRVPNLQTLFQRKGASLPVTPDPTDYRPGDLVTQMLPGNLPHIAIVSDRRSLDGARPLMIHNIGAGAREEDGLFAFPITGHYRFVSASP